MSRNHIGRTPSRRERVLNGPQRVGAVAPTDDDHERIVPDGRRLDGDPGRFEAPERDPQIPGADIAGGDDGRQRPRVRGQRRVADDEHRLVGVRRGVDRTEAAVHAHRWVRARALVLGQVRGVAAERGDDGVRLAVDVEISGGRAVVDHARPERVVEKGVAADGRARLGGECHTHRLDGGGEKSPGAVDRPPEAPKVRSRQLAGMPALVIAAHGSHLNAESSTPTFDHADRIRATGAFDEVREGFWKEEPHFREVLRTVDSDEVYVVPLFISEGYFTEQVIPRELRLEGWDAAAWDSDGTSATHVTLTADDVDKTVHYCGPVGTHDAMSDVIVQRAESVTGDPDVGDGFGLAVVGHGTERNENSAKAVEYHADEIRERDRFDKVQALFMDEDPEVDDVTDYFGSEGGEARSASDQSSGRGPRDIVVVPLFIADGYHTQEDIPEDMGLTDDYRTGWDTPAEVDGHRIWYSGAVGTEALLADVVLERAADAGADVSAAVERVREETSGVSASGD